MPLKEAFPKLILWHPEEKTGLLNTISTSLVHKIAFSRMLIEL